MSTTHQPRPSARRRRPYQAVILYNVMPGWPEHDRRASADALNKMQLGLAARGLPTLLAPVRQDVARALSGLDPREHLIFNWCEGIESAPDSYEVIPPVLEAHGFAYSGADAWTLAATQDKACARAVMQQFRVPLPEGRIYTRPASNGWRRFPALVKPANEHCSIGIDRGAVVDDPSQLQQRIEYVLDRYRSEALVEDFIDGAEYNISIWGNGRLGVLPLNAIDYREFPDYHDRLVVYDAKWCPDSTAYNLTFVDCPAELDPALRRRILAAARAAYRALRLRDYGRIDLRVRDGRPYVLDVNSNPDITMEGGFARSARAAGYDYGHTLQRILDMAACRMPG